MTDRVAMWLEQIDRTRHPRSTPQPGALQRLTRPVEPDVQRHGRSTFSQQHPTPVHQPRARSITLNTATRRVRDGYETRS